MVGLSVIKYKKKVKRGEIVVDADGKPHLQDKEKSSEQQVNGDGKKRKREHGADGVGEEEEGEEPRTWVKASCL